MDFDQQQNKISIDNWLPLESNSGVLNKYLGQLGVNNDLIQFYDVVSFETESLYYLPQPIVGALFVYPDSKLINNHFFQLGDQLFKNKIPQSTYYMKQIAENACGTIAILHNILNLIDEYPFIIQQDSFINQFQEDTLDMNPEQRAEYLNSCKNDTKKKDGQQKSLQEMHKAAVNEGEVKMDINIKPNHHFISFIWKNGMIIELDGRKKGPINYKECEQYKFLENVLEICKTNFVDQDINEIGFNLMALCIGG